MSNSPSLTRPDPGSGPGEGGFLPPRRHTTTTLPSPAPSTASSHAAATLPHPRSRPLVPGSKKEDYARDYVARRLMHISRRYVKKFGIPDPADLVAGYETMEEVCRDMEEVVDVLWFSGTPTLQIPYLLNIALAFNTYLPSFPPQPRPTFALLRKLDHCFASLLVGHDVKTKKPLPGFTSTSSDSRVERFTGTDKVRTKSLADETRMLVAMVMSGESEVVDNEEEEDSSFEERRRHRRRERMQRRRQQRPPVRARTETDSEAGHGVEPVGVATARSLLPGNSRQELVDENENVEMEDISGGIDVNDLDFSSDEEDNRDFGDNSNPNNTLLPSSPSSSSNNKKRKADKITRDVVMTDQAKEEEEEEEEEEGKGHRVKVEEEKEEKEEKNIITGLRVNIRDMPPPDFVDASPFSTSPITTAAAAAAAPPPAAAVTTSSGNKAQKEQFHFALDDDDDDDDDDANTNMTTMKTKDSSSNTTNLPVAAEPLRQSTASIDDQDDRQETEEEDEDEDEDEEYLEEEDEEDEEMHMNVAKVYEKTLMLLGQTLGESVVDG
ncbi:hypothetical protein F5Y17DRAFT_444566 [Xylariaceae sp. FL0594]|nr:hypothetical protein F5Y17DRAFT_444566 [Xylariaceae sp. FL0594]